MYNILCIQKNLEEYMEEKKKPIGLIIGAVIVCILVVAVICVIVVLLKSKNNKNTRNSQSNKRKQSAIAF